ncbi:helix-turn-helix transcriptional regulator [Shimazuella sp. AN120528]|uniref:tetratricopeptide repeat protein n=1 Tax=Shimazuella soli TaxID=1892854 RepID=UPI001F0D45B1|nr:tetratricopeptide repeat protein [Shimazuella soli]MCH5584238.1 helix-turn-helix transcriptional regulator [Shimazuella soli]
MDLEKMAVDMIQWGKTGHLFRSMRKEMKINQEELADEFISASTISNIELNVRNVHPEKYIYLAKKLGILEKILGLVTEKEKHEQEVRAMMSELEELMHVDPKMAVERVNQLDIGDVPIVAPVKCYIEGVHHYYEKQWDHAHACFQKTIGHVNSLPELENSNLYAASLNQISRVFHFQGKYTEALECVEKGLKVFVRDGERRVNLYHLLLNRSIYLNRLEKVELAYEAIKELYDEIEFLKENNRFLEIPLDIVIHMYVMFGIILRKLNQPQKALSYADEGAMIALNNKNFDQLLDLRVVCGNVYFILGNLTEAQKYYIKALELEGKITPSKKYLLIPAYQSLGLTYLELKMWSQAQEMLEKAVDISDREGRKIWTIDLFISLGRCSAGQKLYKDAVNYYQQAEKLALQHDKGSSLHEIIALLCSCYERINDIESLHSYKEKLYDVSMETWGCKV